jgi:hypothetical protein
MSEIERECIGRLFDAAERHMKRADKLEQALALFAASPADYWAGIVAEVEAAGKQCRHALLLNHQAAHLLAWANIARAAFQPSPPDGSKT